MTFSVYLIGLPESVWRSWPEEYPLTELANDSLALKHLINSEIDIHSNQFRYIQICERIQTLAIQRFYMERDLECFVFEGKEAEDYVSFMSSIECSSEANSFKLDDLEESTYSRGSQEFPFNDLFSHPGDGVLNTIKALCEAIKLGIWDKKTALTIWRKKDFYEKMYELNYGIVEVIDFN